MRCTGWRATAASCRGSRSSSSATIPASESYVGNKMKMTAGSGMRSFDHRLPDATSEAELLTLVARLNADPAVHGILVQLPLPKQIDPHKVIAAIDPAKDVDGFHPVNAGRLVGRAAGAGALHPIRLRAARQNACSPRLPDWKRW